MANRLPDPQAIGKKVKRNGVVETVARGHFTAMPYADVPSFVGWLRAEEGTAARALEFLILTATRTNETIGLRWEEVDVEAATWTVPIARLKTGKLTRTPFVVPLSDRALAIIEEMRASRASDFVFAGRREGRPLSDMSFLMLLRRMNAGVTAHGFRSSFRDWAGDRTSFSRETCEAALGHLVGGVEAAYRRSDALAKRRLLMNAWAAFCEPPDGAAGNVLPFGLAKA